MGFLCHEGLLFRPAQRTAADIGRVSVYSFRRAPQIVAPCNGNLEG
jgi:hypothetical protein